MYNVYTIHICLAIVLISICFFFFCRQLPVPYGKTGINSGTSIPLPATVLVTRRCPPDKVRPLPPTPGHTQRKSKNIFLV